MGRGIKKEPGTWQPPVSGSPCAPTLGSVAFPCFLVGNTTSIFSLSKDKNTLRHVKGFFFFAEIPSTLLPTNSSQGNPASPHLPNSQLDASQTAISTTQAAFGRGPSKDAAELVTHAGPHGSLLGHLPPKAPCGRGFPG